MKHLEKMTVGEILRTYNLPGPLVAEFKLWCRQQPKKSQIDMAKPTNISWAFDILKEMYSAAGAWYDIEGAKEELLKRIQMMTEVEMLISGIGEPKDSNKRSRGIKND
jgi:hypothetical protein